VAFSFSFCYLVAHLKGLSMTEGRRMRLWRVMAAVLVLFVVMLALGGCRSRQKLETAPDSSEEPYRFESEGKVPVLDPSQVAREVDKVDTFEEMPVTDEGVAVENVVPEVVEPEKAVEPAAATEEGFRVQVFATGSRESAETVRRAVEARLGAAAYVERIDGIFKVRVGDCRARPEAEALRQKCRDAGYADAWIVASTVVVKP
jgi:cell division protein FtsN